MLLQKYENLLQKFNLEIANGNFDINIHKEKLEKIIEIYKAIKIKDYHTAQSIIKSLWLEDNIEESIECEGSIEDNGISLDNEKSEKKDECEKIMSPWCYEVVASSPMKESMSYWGERCMAKKSASISRDWNIETVHDEDNIEAFNSIEMMSAIFLQNIKDKIWTQK